jgi:hypothetical protein
MTVWAKDEMEVETYIAGVQRIMQGEEARTVLPDRPVWSGSAVSEAVMDVPKGFEQLWRFLSGRAAFCIVYRVLSALGKEIELELLCGTSAYGDSISELAAGYKDSALNCCKIGKNGLMPIDPSRPANSSGRRWRGYVVATGPTRETGHVIMMKILVTDETEMSAYVTGVQRIMQGEEARNLPRPGDD